MAISYVGGVTGGRAGATTTTTQSLSGTLTGGSDTSPAAGDFVVVYCSVASDGTTIPTSQTISGNNSGAYSNAAFQSANDTLESSSQLNYQFMGGTPDTSLTIPSSANNRNAQRWVVHVFRGVSAATPLDVTAVPASGIDTGRPDPAAITPSTAGAWIVAFYASAAAAGTAYTAPTDFATDWLGNTTADTADCMQGGGYYTGWSSGAYNPAAITAGGTTGAGDAWTAMTIALRPEPATQSLTQDSSYSNSNTLNYTHTVSASIDLTQSSTFSNSNGLAYAHTVTPGEVALAQSARYDNSNTLNYTHDISQGGANQDLAQASRFDNSNGLAYAHTVSASIDLAQSARFDNSNTLTYQHTVTPGEVALAQSARFDSSNTLTYEHAISTSLGLTQDSRFDNSSTYYLHSISQDGGGQSLTQSSRFDNAETYYAHTLTPGQVDLSQGARFDNSNTFYGHNATTSSTLAAELFSNINVFYAHAVEGSYSITSTAAIKLAEIWQRMELDAANPVTVSATSLSTGAITQVISSAGATRSGVASVAGDPETQIAEIWQRLGLDSDNPLVQTSSVISFGAITLAVAGTDPITVTRQ